MTEPLSPYPFNIPPHSVDCATALNKIAQIRSDDRTKWNNLNNVFIAGRRVAKVPANSSDTSGNVAGDFNVTTAYAYFCINNAGTVEWVRAAVGTF
jgi:hypothetical protein